MASSTFVLPYNPAFSSNGLPVPGAKLNFYLAGTLTRATVYQDVGLTVPHSNPVEANSAGRFADIYFDDAISLRVILTDADDVTLDESDPYLYGGADFTAADILTKLLTVDGSGSGVDADKLRGTTPTAFGLSLIDDAAAANARTTLGLVIGTDVQAYDAELAALASVTSAANKLPYFTGSGTAAVADITATGRSMVAAASADAQRVLLHSYAMAKLASSLTGQDWSGAGGTVGWDGEIADVGGWHSNATNNSRLTVPAGVSVIQLGCTLAFSNVAANDQITVAILKNGAATWDGRPSQTSEIPGTSPRVSLTSGPLEVIAGDYFEVSVTLVTDTSVDLAASASSFWARAI